MVTYLVKTSNLESECSTIMAASIHVVSEHEDKIKQFFKELGILQVA